MSVRSTAPVCLLLVLAAAVPAQLSVGDIGVTGSLTTATFALIDTSGPHSVAVPGGYPGGQTAATILHDPFNPNSFLIGGVGFIGRATITSPTTSTFTPITTSVNIVAQMSWDGPTLVVVDFGTDQVVRVDPVTGGVTPVTSGAQPWGADANAGVFDPRTGDIYVGALNAIYRIPAGTTTPVLHASGWGTASYVSGIVIDPWSTDIVATLLQVNRVVRINSAGVLSDLVTGSAIAGPNALDVDPNGDFIVGGTSNIGVTNNVWRVPHDGGAKIPLGLAPFTGTTNGVAVVKDAFSVMLTPIAGGGGVLSITGVPPGTTQGYTLPTLDTSLPLGQGPVFGISPDLLTLEVLIAFPVAQPGNPLHWSWPVSPPLFPASPLVFAPGTVPVGTTVDFIGVAFDPVFFFQVTQPIRVTFN